jgi:Tol biopolymer transport system component
MRLRLRRVAVLWSLVLAGAALGLAGATGANGAARAWISYVVYDPLGGPGGSIERVAVHDRERVFAGYGTAFAWSPDGTWVAVVEGAPASGELDLYLVGADGFGRRQLTSNPGAETTPTWSRDGRLLAFVHRPPGGQWTDESWLVVLDTESGARWTVASDLVAGETGSWSPDGSELVYAARRGDLAVVAADGSAPTRWLTNTGVTEAGPTLERAPQWSPDGTWIAFVRRPGNPNYPGELWLVRPDGSEERRLAARAHPQFAWSPDGRSIAFTPDPTQGCDRFCVQLPEHRQEIRVLDLAGGSPRRLTGTSSEFNPAWSTDGRKLAFRGPATTSGR